MKQIKIEMIHDLVCSWCPIGYSNLKQALHNLNIEADWYFLPFELNPDMPPEGEKINDHLARHYHWNETKLIEYRAHLLGFANEAGVKMDFSKRTHYYNSHNAHLLMHWCESINQQQAMKERLMKAYFEQGIDIGQMENLLNLVTDLGLDPSSAKAFMESKEAKLMLMTKQERVSKIGLSSVPAFIINDNVLITGSNSVSIFEEKMNQILGTSTTKEAI